MRTQAVVFSFLLLVGVGAASAADYDRKLIPITAAAAAGGYGSSWTTHVLILFEQHPTIIGGFCYVNLPPLVATGIPYEASICSTPSGDPPGSIIYVDKTSEPVHVGAYLEQDAQQDRTLLPVVDEAEFRTSAIYFLSAKHEPSKRLMLRVYSLDTPLQVASVRVRVMARTGFPMYRWDTIFNETATLTAAQVIGDLLGTPVPLRPLAVSIPLQEVLAATENDAPLTISVQPEVEGLRLWAFLSETSNSTNAVRLILPE